MDDITYFYYIAPPGNLLKWTVLHGLEASLAPGVLSLNHSESLVAIACRGSW